MDDLIAFLRERLDEDEQAARDRLPYVQFGEQPWQLTRFGSVAIMHGHRVMAEVDAKRRLVGLHFVRSGTGGAWDTDPPAICNEDNDPHPCGTLRCVALPYAGHTDYRQEWKP